MASREASGKHRGKLQRRAVASTEASCREAQQHTQRLAAERRGTHSGAAAHTEVSSTEELHTQLLVTVAAAAATAAA